MGALGLGIAVWSVVVFLQWGDGTPAPWDPPERFVARGPYRHVRNPMMIGVLLLLLAEGLVVRSWVLLLWWGLLVLGIALYIPLVEEKTLEERFGETYRRYRRHVPRWIPRRTAWQAPEDE